MAEAMLSSPGSSCRSDEDGEETVTITPRELLAKLNTAWMNERLAPDLLPPLTEEVTCMLQLIKSMEENMAKLEKGDIRLGVHKLEVERIRYLISSYLRLRLAKIQEYSWSLQEQESKRGPQTPSVLSPDEQKFLKEYCESVESHLKTLGTGQMPKSVSSFKKSEMTVAPNMDSFVFLRVNQESTIQVDDAEGRHEIVSLDEGSQHIIRYRPVASLVPPGAIDLV